MPFSISAASANAMGVPVDQPRSLQSMIELTYLQAANDLLYNNLQQLNQYLATTNRAVQILTQLQNLHNMLEVVPRGTFPSAYLSAGVSASAYKRMASAFFGQPIFVSAGGIFAASVHFVSTVQSLLVAMTSVITALSTSQVTTSAGGMDPNGLLAQMKDVFRDLQNASSSNLGLVNWVDDNYNAVGSGASKAGLIQQNLTNAITAAESLNTTQTETVRNFLYLFEEYYKSASAMLQQITQIIQKMADNIKT